MACSGCSNDEFMAQRVDAYKTAVALLTEAKAVTTGNGAENGIEIQDILTLAVFLSGSMEG